MMRSRLLRWGRLLLALAILFFLIKRFAGLLEELKVEAVSFQPFWLIASLGTLLGYRTLLVYPWRTLYHSASQTQVSFQAAWTLFQLSQFGKYLPGTVGQFVGIIALCRPLGISTTSAVVSTLQGLAFQCVLGFGMGAPVLHSPAARHFWHNWVAKCRLNAPFISNGLVIAVVITVVIGGVACVFLVFLRKGVCFRKTEILQKGVQVMFSVFFLKKNRQNRGFSQKKAKINLTFDYF